MKRRESNRAPREFLILWHDGREHRTTRLTVPHDASDETADDTIRNFANSFAADLHWMVDVTGRRVRQYDEPWRHLDDDGVEEYLG